MVDVSNVVGDYIEDAIVGYVLGVSFDDLDADVLGKLKLHVLDSIGVTLASRSAEPIPALNRVASMFPGDSPTLCCGSTTLDLASFINTFMVRYWDYNDTYISKTPSHPSDIIGTALTVASRYGSSGRDFLTALAIGYELITRFCDTTYLETVHGWDHTNFTGIGHLAVAAKLMHVNSNVLWNALSIYVTSYNATRQIRVGELSHWKAGITADKARNAVMALIFAMSGLTGPSKPFEGERGFIRQLMNGDFDPSPIRELENMPKPNAVLRVHLKKYPVEYYLQSVIDSLTRIREDYGRIGIDDVDEINVHLNEHVFRIANPDNPERWFPRTKETADHSLPWVLAIALIHGTVDLSHYRAEYYSSNEVVNVMRRIKVNIDPELNKYPPDSSPIRITIKLRNGKEVEGFTAYPRGHVKNPMSEDEIEEKFRRLTRGVLTREGQEEVIRLVKDLENLTNINTLIKALTQT